MRELIKIHYWESWKQKRVSGSDLHKFLEVGRDFPTRIRGRIKRYGFVENQDFITFPKIVERKKGNKGADVRIEYALTLDMAEFKALAFCKIVVDCFIHLR